jgi:hypothetical protein
MAICAAPQGQEVVVSRMQAKAGADARHEMVKWDSSTNPWRPACDGADRRARPGERAHALGHLAAPGGNSEGAGSDSLSLTGFMLRYSMLVPHDRIVFHPPHPARHPRFILRLASEQTVLIAHNIDLAPRVTDLQARGPRRIRRGVRVKPQGRRRPLDAPGPQRQTPCDWLTHKGRKYRHSLLL